MAELTPILIIDDDQELCDLLADWLPKAPAYRLRALDPDAAPSSSSVEHSG